MSWNGSDSSPTPPADQRQIVPAAPRTRRGLIAGLIIVALGSAALFFLTRSRQPSAMPEQPKKPARIAAATPAIVTNAPPKTEQELHPGMVKVRGKWYPEYNEKGGKIWISANWVKYHTPVVNTNRTNLTRLSRAARIFEDSVDQDIADMLYKPLGTFYIGEAKFTQTFVRRFLKSLEHPIVVSESDDDFTKEVKRAVIDTKIELKARHDAGEDIAQIMTDTRKEMKKLGDYKMEIEELARKEMNAANGDTEAMQSIYDAANKMLAERSIEPMRMPGVLVRNLKLNSKLNDQKKGESK